MPPYSGGSTRLIVDAGEFILVMWSLDPTLNEYVIVLSTPIMDLAATNVLGIVHRVV